MQNHLWRDPVPNTLIVVVAARISDWTTKGEIPPSYFNPANGFDRIVILSLVSDAPSDDALAQLCGEAKVEYHCIPLLRLDGLIRTLFIPGMVGRYIHGRFKPYFSHTENLAVRAYGDTFAGMVAAILGRHFKCISVASIHTTHGHSPRGTVTTIKQRLIALLESLVRKYTHATIDFLAPVYSPALGTIAKRYSNKVHLIHNAVAVQKQHIKTDYAEGRSLDLVTVGRLITGKSVLPILHAVKQSKFTRLTIIGDGPESPHLKSWVKDNEIADRVEMIARKENSDLVDDLRKFDAFVAYTEYREVPKTVIEAGLVGLPVILNRQAGHTPAEYDAVPIVWASGAPESYQDAFNKLHNDDQLRRQIGHETRQKFQAQFDPEHCNTQMFRLLTSRAYSINAKGIPPVIEQSE
ncbi:glycosyltransferase family 4 protein [Thalassospira povalilytica]|uniref:glycosyltransferase family 4 protein n=1 Tax=Thalassospira povalilytica TaxID=732237 RepID=UPI003AA80F5A